MPTSKRPPIDGGKNSLAARKKYSQLQESEQRQRDRAQLLVLVGKQPTPAVPVAPGKPSSTSERYNARVASAEKARSSTSTDSTDLCVLSGGVAEKIVFEGDGGKSKLPQISDLVVGGGDFNSISQLVEGEGGEDGEEKDDDGEDNKDDGGGSVGGGSVTGGGKEGEAEEEAENALAPVDPYFFCCVDSLCRNVDDQDAPRQICINCNGVAHFVCSENFLVQTPVEPGFDITISDFNKSARSRILAIPKSEHDTIHFCVKCMGRIKVLKFQKMNSIIPNAPRKLQSKKFPAKILNELRRLAAFHCQLFIFLDCEKSNRETMYALMVERFHGDEEKKIKGACDQLVDGDNCFSFLYNVGEGESGRERSLKSMCCGSDTSSVFVAGVHFTANMIKTKSNKKLSGRSLWTTGLSVHRSLKKAMAIVPKLDGKVVNLAKNHQVVGYASGKNLESFIQVIDNGMYALTLQEGKKPDPDNDDTKEDDENYLEEVVDNSKVLIDSLDLFGDTLVAPEGYCFFGKLSFLCLGPSSSFYAETLSSTPRLPTSVDEKKLMGRAAMKKEITARKSTDRNVGGSDRGMSLATKASFGFMAQNEDDAVQRHRDMRWATLTKQIETEQKMIDVKMKLMDTMVQGGSGEQLRMSVLTMMDRIEQWNSELGLLGQEKRASNPIVGKVLEHAARSMGMMASKSANEDDGWVCNFCTYQNTDADWTTKCRLCNNDRPKQRRAKVVAPSMAVIPMLTSTMPMGNLKDDDDYVTSVLNGNHGDMEEDSVNDDDEE